VREMTTLALDINEGPIAAFLMQPVKGCVELVFVGHVVPSSGEWSVPTLTDI